MGNKTFLGFGFGPIQSGLMLYEAQASGNFSRFLVSEVDRRLVDVVRKNGDSLSINIARADGIETARLADIEVLNPQVPADRERICCGIRAADEMATAIPSVSLYTAGGKDAIAALLAENVDAEKDRILYAAENNNYAAGILRGAVEREAEGEDGERLRRFYVVDTVIGKMSGVIRGRDAVEELGLEPMAPGFDRAVLVEEFNRILISRLPGVERGITVFEEKDDLLPFEEAKLFGHNAVHCVLGYLAHLEGCRTMSEIRGKTALLELGRRAFIEECGAALIAKHGGTGEELFTPAGFQAYAADLLQRMVNPYLHDLVERICRDPVRKLGYSDRLIGAMREALRRDVRPEVLSRGAFAALVYLVDRQLESGIPKPADRRGLDDGAVEEMLEAIWRDQEKDRYRAECAALVQQARVSCNLLRP